LLLLLLQQLVQYRLFRILANHIILADNGINYAQIVFMAQVSKGFFYAKMYILLIVGNGNETEKHNGLVQPSEDAEG